MTNKIMLLRQLREAAQEINGLAALKIWFRPLVCPLHVVLNEIPAGARLFDIGCGSGSFLFLAVRLRQAAVAHGYDVSACSIGFANQVARRTPNMAVRCLGANEFPDLGGYDVITVIDVLHHIAPADQRGFLHRIYETIDPGAKLVLLDINGDHRIRATCNLAHDLVLNREWVHATRPAIVASELFEAGASVEHPILIKSLWYSHYLLTASKPH
ncbi:MAG TPA: class I SAM-dependent methyltransferase [Stellaceae bacterium]|nr:class I SAM-dependent methyltransferase [Stellaceae bacterium]